MLMGLISLLPIENHGSSGSLDSTEEEKRLFVKK
jgi:hypothetical protein